MERIERQLVGGPLAARRSDVLELVRPTVGFESTRCGMDELAIGQSRLGGLPDLPDEVPWPRWKGEPQSFLAQVALAELDGLPGCDMLPESGWFVFFYSARQDTWGFEPADRSSWQVRYLPRSAVLSRRPGPDGGAGESVFHPCTLGPRPIMTLPPWESIQVRRLGLDDDAIDAYCDLLDAIHSGLPHLMLGWPDQIQGDIAAEAQLVSHGLNLGDGSGWASPRATALLERSDEWRLLFQVGSDENAGMMWGDIGNLYFSIRNADLAGRDFGQAWMTLQCS